MFSEINARSKSLLLCLLLTYCITGYANPSQLYLQFHPEKIAKSEVTMWQAYYADDTLKLAQSLAALCREQFHLSLIDTLTVAYSAAQAATIFSKLPHGTTEATYKEKVLPSLTIFYEELKSAVNGAWDTNEVAKAELAWWVARRSKIRKDIKKVGQKIAKVYQLLYRKNNADIQKAGYLRAKAARLRDIQSQQAKIDWQAIQKLLLQSYQYLHDGITQ